MLKDLGRDDWLKIVGLTPDDVPHSLILRGTRNLRRHYNGFSRHFETVIELGSPNALFEDIFIGTREGQRVGYASVYGPAMASEVAHLFSVLGTKRIIQTGVCGGLADGIEAGDIVIPIEAGCGDGASQAYLPGRERVPATPALVHWLKATAGDSVPIHTGDIWTTGALLAEGDREINAWHDAGYAAVDMETATTFAVARYYGVDCVSILSVFDNPRHGAHLGMDEGDKADARNRGEAEMLDLVLRLATHCD